jgi:PAS domain S-box-containing protein
MKNRIIVIGIFVGIIVWIFEAIIETFIFRLEDSIIEQIFFPNLHEIWMRLLLVGVFILFIVYIDENIKIQQAEKALRGSEERLKLLMGSAEDIIILQDAEGKYLYYNAAPIYDIKSEDVLGKTPYDFFDKKTANNMTERVKEVFKSGESMNAENSVNWKGQNLWYNDTLTPVKDKDGTINSVMTISRNITNRKEAEEKLKKYAEQLEESNSLKDLFAEIMRHDLINPLGIVIGAVDSALLDTPDNRELQMIKRNSNRVLEIIQNASTLSRLESAEELEKQSLDLKEVIDNVIIDNAPLFESAGLRLENQISGPLPIVANPLIREVVFNILSNAAKYAAEGKKLVISAIDGKKSYTIMFKDYGPGVPDKHKKDLFNRFKRLHKTGVKGSGLGLTISKKIVELHGGKIWIGDNPEGGSIFYVKVPAG